MFEYLIIVHYFTTLIMTGAIWLAQLSQYPLLEYVGKRNFINYEKQHIHRISGIAWFIIYLEIITGAALLFYTPSFISFWVPAAGFVLVCIIWATTHFIQYPIHKKLAHGFDKDLLNKLVKTNWIRTIVWSLRAILWSIVIFKMF